jgi:hypothetical protein
MKTLMKPIVLAGIMLGAVALPGIAYWRIQATFGTSSAKTGQAIPIGETLYTGANGSVFGLHEEMGVQTNTFPFSEITLSAYSKRPDGGRRAVWYIGKGITDFKVPRLIGKNSAIRVISKYGVTDIKGTQLNVRAQDKSGTVGVLKGTVETSNAGVTRKVSEGKYVLLRAGMPPSQPLEADYELELKIEPIPHKGDWKAYVASGNVIVKSGQILGASAPVAVGDIVKVVNPVGKSIDYQIVPGKPR